MRLDDVELVRREYADPSRLAARRAIYGGATGPDALELAFQAVAEIAPHRVLEVGCGHGDLAARLARELGAEVTALDQSERMVELTRAQGVDAVVGDVQEMPFPEGTFDCAVAAWMLFHVPDLDRGLAELRRVLRPGGRLVAATSSDRNLHELWGFFGKSGRLEHSFSADNGEAILARLFTRVERRNAVGTIVFADWEAARRCVADSVTRSHLADDLPRFVGPLKTTCLATIFVAETVP